MSKITFSQKLKRLEEVVSLLERPDVELEEGLKLLEEGVELHKECQHLLTQTQARITKLLTDAPNSENPADPSIETEARIETATLFEVTSEPKLTDDQSDVDRLPF